ncbi:MAG: hypothetical protein K2X90_01785 [Candidatus Babeliaceae bacterium]|nr:hypothetical protein [Candidatus Babeliaceae bacterium]
MKTLFVNIFFVLVLVLIRGINTIYLIQDDLELLNGPLLKSQTIIIAGLDETRLDKMVYSDAELDEITDKRFSDIETLVKPEHIKRWRDLIKKAIDKAIQEKKFRPCLLIKRPDIKISRRMTIADYLSLVTDDILAEEKERITEVLYTNGIIIEHIMYEIYENNTPYFEDFDEKKYKKHMELLPERETAIKTEIRRYLDSVLD